MTLKPPGWLLVALTFPWLLWGIWRVVVGGYEGYEDLDRYLAWVDGHSR
jgi:hypothetical protein